MKKSIKIITCWSITLGLLMACPFHLGAQEDSTQKKEKEERQSLIYLGYHLVENHLPYISVQTKNKEGKAFLVAAEVPVTLYLDKDQDEASKIGEVKTNKDGLASTGIPPSLAAQWDHLAEHTFYAHTNAGKDFNEASEELSITLGQLVLDTSTDGEGKTVKATLFKRMDSAWVPVPEADIRLTVKRMSSYLNIGEDESYTTDSSGVAEGTFGLKDLPGDSKGNIQLVALVDDNDEVGSLQTSLSVPWGIHPERISQFGQRSLWATGNRAPIWLMVMAYGCIIGVWSVVIYLITRLFKIKRLGKEI